MLKENSQQPWKPVEEAQQEAVQAGQEAVDDIAAMKEKARVNKAQSRRGRRALKASNGASASAQH